MKYHLHIFMSILCFVFQLQTLTGQETTISDCKILERLSSLSHQERKEFCHNLHHVSRLINQELTYVDHSSNKIITMMKAREALPFLKEKFPSYLEWGLHENKRTGFWLRLERYLLFALLFDPQKCCLDSFSNPQTLTDKILDHMGRIRKTYSGDEYETDLTEAVEKMAQGLWYPLSISPQTIHLFQLGYTFVLENTDSCPNQDLDSDEIKTEEWTKEIFTLFGEFTKEQSFHFFQQINDMNDSLQHKLLPYADLCHDVLPLGRRFEMGEAEHLLKILKQEENNQRSVIDEDHKESKKLQKISTFPLLSMEETPLLFKDYLQFCLNMHPHPGDNIQVEYLQGIPFYSQEHYPYVQPILQHLGIHLNAQFSKDIRLTLGKISSFFKKPLALDPLNLLSLKTSYEKFQQLLPGCEKFKGTTQKTEEWILRNKKTIYWITAGTVVGGSSLIFWWYGMG